MTNETIASQLAHRTIRAYKDQPLTEEEVTGVRLVLLTLR